MNTYLQYQIKQINKKDADSCQNKKPKSTSYEPHTY